MKKWKARVQDIYENLGEFRMHNEIYKISKRLEYKSAKKLWKDNPWISGDVNPRNFSVIKKENGKKV